jgi:hypothetical protein
VKKSTLVRSDKPHAVKMAEGANVAQRKSVKKTGAPEAPKPAPDNIQKITPGKAPKTATLEVPAMPLKPARAKASARAAHPEPKPNRSAQPKAAATPKAPAKPAAHARPAAAPPAPPAAPPEPVWEQDNPIKNRIEKLKTRNAQLAEQLQRLQSSPTARGKRP